MIRTNPANKFNNFQMNIGQKIWNEKDYAGLESRSHHRLDLDIFHEVCESLTDNPRLDASQIEVQVTDGRVLLRGLVSGRMDKREAERCIEFLPGVKDVMNELHFNS
ncbi:MAG TPA: BON domain-containing protein [Bacteriovoracaceae bacterium]|nr:BON domain-containing protein [Bacteriovoracaceae bacterium]